MIRRPPSSPLFPYTPLFRSRLGSARISRAGFGRLAKTIFRKVRDREDPTASTRDACATQNGTQHHLWSAMPSRIRASRSEEHTSELQSQSNLVCRLLLEKKK